MKLLSKYFNNCIQTKIRQIIKNESYNCEIDIDVRIPIVQFMHDSIVRRQLIAKNILRNSYDQAYIG